MSDNLTAPASGAVLASDEISGVHYPRSKISIGGDGVAADVSASNPMPTVETDPSGHALRPAAGNVTGTFTAVGSSAALIVRADFNVTLWGTFNGVIQIERSFDNTNWHPLTALGNAIAFNAPVTEIFSEPEYGVRYRLTCTSYTSGTINYRISQ